ncbi:Vi polysaccharide biosynthesis protein VipB/TviC [Parcubacteria bacterium DG_74_2]|nr:MAG: Vi polysaccharide biosynthesis protein VipB/TviC [Parcubacteria bacterium DG_74_2]
MKNFNKGKFLITGGAGFIGSNIVEKLLELGEKVIVFDNLSTGREENLRDFLKNPNFKFIQGDLRKEKEVEEAVREVDYILHQAALPSVGRSILDPKSTFESNVSGTLNLLFAAKKYKVKKIVYASSSSIYGPTKILPKKENMLPSPISPYALSKLTGEKLCQIFSENYSLPTVCLRYFNVFGPRQDPNSEYAAVIPKFVSAFLNDKRPTIYGDGLQSRDFTFVENVVEANLKALYSKFNNGQVFNIACGNQTSLLELLDFLNKIFSKNIEPDFAKERQGDIKHSFADISKAEKGLNYSSRVFFEQGLKTTIDWFKRYKV